MAQRRVALRRDPGDQHLPAPGAEETPQLITADEAIERIGLLLENQSDDIKQQLLTIAGLAIAAVIAIDGSAVEVEQVAGLQECVNCALFSTRPH